MNIGVKQNRKAVLIGSKLMNASKLIGVKQQFKDVVNAVNTRNPDITEMDSNILDSQQMPTGIGKDHEKKQKDGLEKGNRQSA